MDQDQCVLFRNCVNMKHRSIGKGRELTGVIGSNGGVTRETDACGGNSLRRLFAKNKSGVICSWLLFFFLSCQFYMEIN